jgi:hypothetical protein
MKKLFSFFFALFFLFYGGQDVFAKKHSVAKTTHSTSQKDIVPKIPHQITAIMDKLYQAFKAHDLSLIEKNTQGKFQDFIDQSEQYAFENNKKYPPLLEAFMKRLRDHKVIHSFTSGENTFVTVLWILHLESGHQPGGYITQVEQTTYLLKKSGKTYKITDSKTMKEFSIYNK